MKIEGMLLISLIIEFFALFFLERSLINFLKSRNLVQHVREELIESHKKKEGTPRGGGVIFLCDSINSSRTC
jgi:UDP-N-acetylmuramyl pentapeptide phosphotransferase/UDP-N-acetylglucosamine-1-phosphate transferase